MKSVLQEEGRGLPGTSNNASQVMTSKQETRARPVPFITPNK